MYKGINIKGSKTRPLFDIEDKINDEKNGMNSILGPLGKQAKPLGEIKLEFNS